MNIPDSEQKAALFTMVVLSSASRSKGDSINNIVLKINGKDAMLLMIVFRLFHDVRKNKANGYRIYGVFLKVGKAAKKNTCLNLCQESFTLSTFSPSASIFHLSPSPPQHLNDQRTSKLSWFWPNQHPHRRSIIPSHLAVHWDYVVAIYSTRYYTQITAHGLCDTGRHGENPLNQPILGRFVPF